MTKDQNIYNWDESISPFSSSIEDRNPASCAQSINEQTTDLRLKSFPEIQYVDKKVTYYIPTNPKPKGEYELRKLAIYATETDSYYEMEKNDLYFQPNVQKSLCVVYRARKITENNSLGEILCSLYKEGCPTPVFKRLQSIEDDCENCFSFEDSSKLSPGRYFLLIGNAENNPEANVPLEKMGTQLCYRFRILTEGAYLPKLQVKRVTVSRPDVVQDIVCGTSGKLDIKVVLREFVEDRYSFKAFCYNSDYQLVGKVETEGELTTKGMNVWLELSLHSSRIWVEGDYSLVFVCNEEPVYLFSFHLSSCSIVKCRIEELQPDSLHYLLVKYLHKNIAWKGEISQLPGMKKIREQLVPFVEETIFDQVRRQKGMKIIMRNKHFTVTGTESSVRDKLMKCLPAMLAPDFSRVNRVDAASLVASKNSLNPYEEIDSLLEDRSSSTIGLKNISVLFSPAGWTVLRKLTDALKDHEYYWSLVIYGTETELAQLFEMAPEWRTFFPEEHRLQMENLSLADMLYLTVDMLEQQRYKLSQDAELRLYNALKQAWDKGELMGWGDKEIYELVTNRMLPVVRKRMIKKVLQVPPQDVDILQTLHEDDLELSFGGNKLDSFEEAMKPLQTMIGLTEVKERLTEHFNLSCLQKMRQQVGLPTEDGGAHHMIFTGNPGTGKTTVAKLIGKIYHSLGVLSKGEVVVTDRSHLVGQFIGDTEKNMLDILEKSRGNVLFIDEAYTLYCGDDGRRDFGLRAIEALLPVLAQKNPDMIIIMAGYEKEMELMINGNQGLAGRFPHKLHFADYTAEELFQIGQNVLEKGEYLLAEETKELFKKRISDSVANRNALFSNARWVEQVINIGILPIMAKRLMRNRNPLSKDMLRTIQPEDVEEGMSRFVHNILVEKPRRNPIGFK